MDIPNKPWGRIIHIFEDPLQDDDIKTEINTSKDTIDNIKKSISVINSIVKYEMNQIGIPNNTNPVSLDKNTREGILGKNIKNNPDWITTFYSLVSELAPGIDLEEILRDPYAIPRPDWNSEQFGLLDCMKTNKGLTIKGAYSHSYMDMIGQSKNNNGTQKYPVLRLDPMSVVGALLTSDPYLVLGWRGGHNFADTIMNLPAGSVEPHSGKNPISESFYDKELPEETGLIRDDLDEFNTGLIAITEDYSCQAKRSYAVYKANTPLSFNDLVETWKTKAKDRGEHRRFVPYPDPAVSDNFLDIINSHMFDFEKAKPPLSNTVPDNLGVWLPQCALNVLSYGVHNSFPYYTDNIGDMEHYLNGYFDLTTCFKK